MDATPPPTKYFITKVLPAGETPKVLVFKKFEGSIDDNNRFMELDVPKPIFFEFGKTKSSFIFVSPLPNCISNVLFEFTFTENLFGTFCTSKIYGTACT